MFKGAIIQEKPVSKISEALGEHYTSAFLQHGETPQGVDWGPHPEDHTLRLDRMLAVADVGTGSSVLDVGCGFGSLLDRANDLGRKFNYTGIDLSRPMIDAAQTRHPESHWLVGDILGLSTPDRFDYVVCNGILTQKLDAGNREMDAFCHALVTKMFGLCRVGIAFNVMTTHVNFAAPNLYYRNPVELLAWAMTTLSPKVKIDHAYPLFEYTLYVYREEAPGVAYQSHRSASKLLNAAS